MSGRRGGDEGAFPSRGATVRIGTDGFPEAHRARGLREALPARWLDVEGILALRSISQRCAERIGNAARILEAQNEVLYAEERANAKPRENER